MKFQAQSGSRLQADWREGRLSAGQSTLVDLSYQPEILFQGRGPEKSAFTPNLGGAPSENALEVRRNLYYAMGSFLMSGFAGKHSVGVFISPLHREFASVFARLNVRSFTIEESV